ncbi:sensor histidine kinase [Paenibacillus sinopodophylli]|uniref:sensor histidine kinase n=1 Tax=Paenibacillus sinopodophylli TaxID=1837342 RepID=UPI00110CA8B6|nr:HAMP domain-containing sensor histidine kinase [Paenibacillus sinopodophylli]
MNRSGIPFIERLISPRSLRYQLLSRSLLILAVLLMLIGILQYVIMKDFIFKNKAESLNTQIMSMPMNLFNNGEMQSQDESRAEHPVKNTEETGSSRPQKEPHDSPLFYQPGLSILFVSLEGTVTDISKDTNADAPILSKEEYIEMVKQLQKHEKLDYRIMNNTDGNEQLVVYRLIGPPNKTDGIVQISTDTASLRQLLLTQLAIFAGLSILALAAGLALYLPLLRRTLTPLSRVVLAAQQTDAGSLTTRIPESQGQEEIDRLSDAFNGMLERLESSFETERKTTEKMRRFVADASHELRTPLTSIHGFLEVLLRGAAANPAQLQRALNSMQLESKRINRLVEDLLALAKLDQAPILQLTDTRLDELLEEMEPQLQLLAGNRSVKLELAPSVEGRFHADQMKQVVLNLFLNAVQHTDEETGEISIHLLNRHNEAIIRIIDNGAGIADTHLPHLFERFYRSESSRTRKNGGAGLGLAITQSIVDAHGGVIEVTSRIREGTSFQVTLPLNAE